MSTPIGIDIQSGTWVNLRIDITEKLRIAYAKLKDSSKDIGDLRVIQGEIAAFEYILGLEDKVLKNNQRAFDNPRQ
jgi:hypothetical protein